MADYKYSIPLVIKHEILPKHYKAALEALKKWQQGAGISVLEAVKEGSFTNNPNDPGGATEFGISLRFLKTLGDTDGDGWLDGDLDRDGDVDAEDIRKLNLKDAVLLYETHWWNRYKYQLINDQNIATKVLDFGVNAGSGRAHRILQETLVSGFIIKPLSIDGKFGPVTLKTTNSVNPERLFNLYTHNIEQFYLGLVQKKPSYAEFLNGWRKRAYDI